VVKVFAYSIDTALSDRPIPPARMRRIFPPESFTHCHASGSSPIRHYRSFSLWRRTLLAFGTTATSTRRRRKHSTQRFRANLEQTVIFRSLFVTSVSVPSGDSVDFSWRATAPSPPARILLASTLLFVGPPSSPFHTRTCHTVACTIPHIHGCHAKFCYDSRHLYQMLQIANGPPLLIDNSILSGLSTKKAADCIMLRSNFMIRYPAS
jgi:hypothetical protein